MATKKSVNAIREELRVLNAAADEAATTAVTVLDSPGWLTPEFWTMAGAAMTNLVTVAVLIGWVDHSNADALIKALSALLGASQVIVLNTALIWKYLGGRAEVKSAAITARYRYMESMAIEKFRAERDG